MAHLLHKIIFGLKAQGLRYLVRAPVNELARPRLAATRLLRGAVTSVGDRFPRSHTTGMGWAEDCLQFVYDLNVAPVTYDFTSFLAAAEVERRLRGLSAINVIFILGQFAGVRQELPEYESTVDHHARVSR